MRILVGICGSIAAYRALDFVRALVAQGHEVKVVPTRSGARFLSPTAFAGLVPGAWLDPDPFDASHADIDHIAQARWAEGIVVYAATADFMARASLGLADDFLSLQLLAYHGPVLWAPAMNPSMWAHPTTVEHAKRLTERGHRLVGPVAGQVACGETGIGHIASDDAILAAVEELFSGARPLAGKKVLISAGPMQTPIDAVRFVQNRSSGKTALSFALEARRLGADVDIILGPVAPEMRQRFSDYFPVHPFISVASYSAALVAAFPSCDFFLSIAAVLDFEVLPHSKKLTRDELARAGELSLTIRGVQDFVAMAALDKRPHQTVVAFAAEAGTEAEIVRRARDKLVRKRADYLAANPLWEGLGPDADNNRFWLLNRFNDDVKTFGPGPKPELAAALWREWMAKDGAD